MIEPGRVGANIRHLVGMHGLRQIELAGFVGISVQGLWNIVHGRSEPRSQTVHRFAEAFGISMEDLFADTGACLRAAAAAFERAPVRALSQPDGGEPGLHVVSRRGE
jgi:transcriptional regulator with XRE-family HTH domain